MRIPRATYRLQFNEQFRLRDALALVPYFRDLGISHIYSSPLFKAVPHSAHGYDVCDFTRINPEVGTEAELEALTAALRKENMGMVLDIVPNHMGVASPDNHWWWDVLKHGRASRFANHFDIDWECADPALHGKVVIPVLEADYETVLRQGLFRLLFENEQLVLGYHEHRFPLTSKSVASLRGSTARLGKVNADLPALDKLISQQNYCLEFHKLGDSRLNYRRFFAVGTLAAVRVDDEKVFNATHVLIRRWVENGWFDGLRVDHPDGLRDPGKYLKRLRALAPGLWIVVEKILEPEEMLPRSWPVNGTTGYDFLNQVNGLFIDSSAEKPLTQFYSEFTGQTVDFPALVRKQKKSVLTSLFVTELNRLTGLLLQIAARDKVMKSVPRAVLQDALAEIIVSFPVYRSYIAGGSDVVSQADRAVITSAVRLAVAGRADLSPNLFAYIGRLLLKSKKDEASLNFVERLQQLTGPVMAKGVEDTALYCFNRFTSLNEVGGNPLEFGVSLKPFQQFLHRQHAEWPHSQLTTSTHDTKRAEDVRARLNLLSEIPEIWIQTVWRWSAMNESHWSNHVPDRNAEYLFYQTLVGAWPIGLDRAWSYMEKAANESRQHTTWADRNVKYELALKDFVSGTLEDRAFIEDLDRFVGALGESSALNALAQTLLKLTAPGVPDIYQGCELQDLSLVDPDNRRPVDFTLRWRFLGEAATSSAEDSWRRWAEGFPKLWLIHKTLTAISRYREFASFDFKPLFARGARSQHVAAFVRGRKLIPIVPRFPLKVKNGWRDTAIKLPAGLWQNEFTAECWAGTVRVVELFRKFPVSLLVRKEK